MLDMSADAQTAARLGRVGAGGRVDNRPGASGAIGMGAVKKAAADGYTLLYSNASTAVIAPAVVKSLPYDTGRTSCQSRRRRPVVCCCSSTRTSRRTWR
jgi:tripartite-type tricarboxylate transporter receptor subunit TctC